MILTMIMNGQIGVEIGSQTILISVRANIPTSIFGGDIKQGFISAFHWFVRIVKLWNRKTS